MTSYFFPDKKNNSQKCAKNNHSPFPTKKSLMRSLKKNQSFQLSTISTYSTIDKS